MVFCICFLVIFQYIIFVDGYLIPIKELGLLDGPGQWIRGLDSMGYYILYCIVKNGQMMNIILEVHL